MGDGRRGPCLVVFGTRPELIKLAPVIFGCRTRNVDHIVCTTGQHESLRRQAEQDFGIQADVDLALMVPGQTPSSFSARALPALAAVIEHRRPSVVLVQGDTVSAFTAAYAAYLAGVPVAHVEAGLRTGALSAPFPEEGLRQMLARIAQWHFAPNEVARQALAAEGVSGSCWVTGNTIVDAQNWALERVRGESDGAFGPRRVVVTAHRRENFGEGLRRISLAVRDMATRYEGIDVAVIVHPNPRVRADLPSAITGLPHIRLLEPMGYIAFTSLLRGAWLVMTDSGGVQEEAESLGRPALVLRDVTERHGGIALGSTRLVGTDPARIAQALHELWNDADAYNAMRVASTAYGDGRAGVRIVDILVQEMAALHEGRVRTQP